MDCFVNDCKRIILKTLQLHQFLKFLYINRAHSIRESYDGLIKNYWRDEGVWLFAHSYRPYLGGENRQVVAQPSDRYVSSVSVDSVFYAFHNGTNHEKGSEIPGSH